MSNYDQVPWEGWAQTLYDGYVQDTLTSIRKAHYRCSRMRSYFKGLLIETLPPVYLYYESIASRRRAEEYARKYREEHVGEESTTPTFKVEQVSIEPMRSPRSKVFERNSIKELEE